jgi:hypothetical protein
MTLRGSSQASDHLKPEPVALAGEAISLSISWLSTFRGAISDPEQLTRFDGMMQGNREALALLRAGAAAPWVATAATATRALVQRCTNVGISDDHPAVGLRNVEDMLHRIESGEIEGNKAHRWLGWAQAIVCAGGGATIERLKAINKTASDAAASAHVALQGCGESRAAKEGVVTFARALAIADESMLDLLETHCVISASEPGKFGLANEDSSEVQRLEDTERATRGAYEWLLARGLVCLKTDEHGEYLELTAAGVRFTDGHPAPGVSVVRADDGSFSSVRAGDAIDLFLEYRDKHGFTEERAKWAALHEFDDAEHFLAPKAQVAPR